MIEALISLFLLQHSSCKSEEYLFVLNRILSLLLIILTNSAYLSVGKILLKYDRMYSSLAILLILSLSSILLTD